MPQQDFNITQWEDIQAFETLANIKFQGRVNPPRRTRVRSKDMTDVLRMEVLETKRRTPKGRLISSGLLGQISGGPVDKRRDVFACLPSWMLSHERLI